jgi:multidrug efflux pump subunit AcrA (membrane-fusion protein)
MIARVVDSTVKRLLLVLVGVGLALAGSIWWFASRREPSVDPAACAFATVEFGNLSEIVTATGSVQPRDVFTVGTEMGGKVVAVLADYNQIVEEGDILVRLEDERAQDRVRLTRLATEAARAALRQAEAQRETAARVLERERKRDPEVRRQIDLDVLEGNLRTADAALEAAQVKVREGEEARRQAEQALRKMAICAPVLASTQSASATSVPLQRPGVGSVAPDGTPSQQRRSFLVLDRHVSLNQIIGPPASANLFTLAGDLERVQVVTQVAEGDSLKVMPGQEARFTVAGADDPVFTGKVEEVRLTPAADRGAIFYKVIVDARNQRDAATRSWRLRPGQTASVEIVRRSHRGVWKVPAAALQFQPDDSLLTDAARARLRSGPPVEDREGWRTVWVLNADQHPWPVFVRIGGKNAGGEEGIQDGQFTEALEWETGLTLDPRDPSTHPRLLTGITGPVSWLSAQKIKL